MLWGWAYRCEAYTPARKRKLGYYALPVLWCDRVAGWGNLSVSDGMLHSQLHFVDRTPPRDASFNEALETDLVRMRLFLGLETKHS